MARNEEKQLARLNRYYLEKQKQEELKKRPPRPRLDTLNTARDLRKWLPTITRDIEFYVKQMEVTCYTDSKIEEFKDRIQRLKQEYRAYLHKLRALEPDVSAASWADRPYTVRKRSAVDNNDEDKEDSDEPNAKVSSTAAQDFVPISTPILQTIPQTMHPFGCEKPPPVVWNVNPDTEDQPLQFDPSSPLAICPNTSTVNPLSVCGKSTADVSTCKVPDKETAYNVLSDVHDGSQESTQSQTTVGVVQNKTSSSRNCLNLDYSDSSDEDL